MEGESGNLTSPEMEQRSPQSGGEASTERRSINHHHSSSSRAQLAFLPTGISLPDHLHAVPVGIAAAVAAATAAGAGAGGGSGGGSGSGSILPPAAAISIGIGGSNAASSSNQEQGREAVAAAVAVAGGDGGATGDHERKYKNPISCGVCGRVFLSDKSLFGHMRTHGDRAWKGALPPPVFSREEFADKADLLNPIIIGDENEEEEEEVVVEDDDDDEEDDYDTDDSDNDDDDDGDGDDDDGHEVNQPATAPACARRVCVLPDLNKPPPAEDCGNDEE